MNNLASALTGIDGEHVALSDIAVSAVLRDLLAEVTSSQTYRNDEAVNIEAVYTFPLPLDAVLLSLQVKIGGRVLTGVVTEKSAAEEQYEDAVAAGDAAVMLEELEPGLYTMNVGNLLPGEQVTITFTYALLYRWVGDRLRLFLPTTVAPRYGDSPHQPHQVPETSLAVENMFSLQIEIFGSLRDARFTCPSHEVAIERLADKAVISLQQPKAVMDRDFILNVSAPQAARSFVLCDRDGAGAAAVASFQPFFPGLQQPRALNLAIVIDCSGSMAGDSIEQARRALAGILDGLQAQDNLTLLAFGNSTNLLSKQLLPCNPKNLAKARQFAQQLDANMGGTEIGRALQETYAAVRGSECADIFLVTDGEVSEWNSVVSEARRAGHRIFTVGVGAAVSEAFVRELAIATGGSCELVTPKEGMSDRVIRHFERMRAPRAKRAAIRWPEGAAGIAPVNVGPVFEGDTIVAAAQFSDFRDSPSVVLEIETENGEVTRQELPLVMAPLSAGEDSISTVARLAASLRLHQLHKQAGLQTALHYQLVSPWTNYLVIAERAEGEKSEILPELRKVPQTLAAGWGGAGIVMSAQRDASFDMPVRAPHSVMSVGGSYFDFDLASELRQEPPAQKLMNPYQRLLVAVESSSANLTSENAAGVLAATGVYSDFSDLFLAAEKLGLNVDKVALIILAGLLDGAVLDYLSDAASKSVKELQRQSADVHEAIYELARRSGELISVMQHLDEQNITRRKNAQSITTVLKQAEQITELLRVMRHRIRDKQAMFDHEEAYSLLGVQTL